MLVARRVVLALIALVFAAITVPSLFAPDVMAEGLGYALGNVDARNEFRAVYVGVWLATAALFALAARRPDDRSLYLACMLLLGGQVVGRLLALAFDGPPTVRILPFFVVEAIGAAVLVALRPRAP